MAALFDGLGVHPTPEEMSDAYARAEGWAVGLYLHALSMRDREARAGSGAGGLSRRGSLGPVSDYIGAEVLDHLDQDTRHFLRRTAVLEELRPELCDAVLGRSDSLAVLPLLCDQIQLVIPLDGTGRRFRYHHLLREALINELTRQSPDELIELHRRAAWWFAEAGDLDSAVQHAKATGDRGLIADIVWPGLPGCLTGATFDRLAGWLRGIPDTDLRNEPRLTLAQFWLGLQSGDPALMDQWLLHAEGQAGPHWRDRASVDELAATLAFALALVGRGGLADSATLCAAASTGLPPGSGFGPPAAFLHGVCLTLQRDIEAGRDRLVAAERLARALEQPLIVADALSWRGLLALMAGDPGRGTSLILAATDLIQEHHLERLATSAHCITAQALALALQHDPRAMSVLGAARRLTASADGIAPWFAVCGRLVQARAAVTLGDGSLARLLISEAKAHMNEDLDRSLAREFLAEAEASLASLAVDGVSAAALSPAEIRVLQFLPSHLTLPQIGEHLFLSTNTVKTHALAIYRKFGVSSRDDAVKRARRLGLVDAAPRA